MNKGGIIFGSIFFVCGFLFFCGFVGTSLADLVRAQFWHPTSATLISSDVATYQSRNDNGGSTTMYHVEMQYAYEVAGQAYQGDRATIESASTSYRKPHYKRLARIQAEAASMKGLVVWYNPEDPSESIYDRNPDWRMLILMSMFCSIFMVIGGALIFFNLRDGNENIAAVQVEKDKPWTHNSSWSSPIIYSNESRRVRFVWVGMYLACAFFGSFILVAYDMPPHGNWVALVLAVICFFIVRGLWLYRKRWRALGKVALHLDTHPGNLGGRVAGRINLPMPASDVDCFLFELCCVHSWRQRSGKETKTYSDIIWSSELEVEAATASTGASLQFEFYVPRDLPESSERGSSWHSWKVEVEGETKAGKFKREYEVPVFITGESTVETGHAGSASLSMRESESLDPSLPTDAERIRALESSVELHRTGIGITACMGGSKTGMYFAGFGAIFCVIGLPLLFLLWDLFTGVIFCAVGFTFVKIGLKQWLRYTELSFTDRECSVKTCMQTRFGEFFTKEITFYAQDVHLLKADCNSRTSSGGKVTSRDYVIVLHVHQHKLSLGGGFTSEADAEYIAGELRAVLGKEDSA